MASRADRIGTSDDVRYYVHKWGVRDWRVMRKPVYSLTAWTLSQHTTKQAAEAALRRVG